MHLLHVCICVDSRCVWQNYRAIVILIKTIRFEVLTKIGFGFRAVINSMHSHVNTLFVEIIYRWIMIGWSKFQTTLFVFFLHRPILIQLSQSNQCADCMNAWICNCIKSKSNQMTWQFHFVKHAVNQNIHLLIYSKTYVFSYLIMFNFFM
jgi:hypothetical protein